MIHADTDGLLDKCHCGAVAGFEFDGPKSRAICTECCEQTGWEQCKYCAAFQWNDERRAKRPQDATDNPGTSFHTPQKPTPENRA